MLIIFDKKRLNCVSKTLLILDNGAIRVRVMQVKDDNMNKITE